MGKEIEGAVLQPSERIGVRLDVDPNVPGGVVASVYFRIGAWKGVAAGQGADAAEAIAAAEAQIAAERKRRNV